MKNFILNYDQEEVDNYIVSDYFSKKINLYDYLTSSDISDYLSTYEIADNDKIERIAYEIYGVVDYWDILLLLNDLEPLRGLPYDFDTYTTYIDAYIKNYENDIYSNNIFSETRFDELKKEFYEVERVLTESKRYLKIIKPSKMQSFLKYIKEKGFEW